MVLFAKRKATKITRKGQRAQGTIVGIDVRHTTDAEGAGGRTRIAFAVDVEAPQPFTASVDQYLEPLSMVRLGMRFPLSYHGDNIVLHENEWGIRPHDNVRTRGAVARGISHDREWSNRAISKAFPAHVTIVDARLAEHALSTGISVRLRAEGPGFEPFEVEQKHPGAPFYAEHLNNIGATLPGWARPNKSDGILIDWISATLAHPGVGEPPGDVAAMFNNVLADTHTGQAISFREAAQLLRDRSTGPQ
ncbi:MAG: hypothetical protein R2704_11335 [Microthrixaceae bacterium]